jgi:hypothetical protein
MMVTAALWNVAVVNNLLFLGYSHDHTGDAGDGATLAMAPSGMIGMFDVACPSGWTRVSAWDNKFIRGAATYGGTGGSATHTHSGPSHTHNTTDHTHIDATHSHTSPSHTHLGPSHDHFAGHSHYGVMADNGDTAIALYVSMYGDPATGITGSGGAGVTEEETAGTLSSGAGTSSAGTGTTGIEDSLPAYAGIVFCERD